MVIAEPKIVETFIFQFYFRIRVSTSVCVPIVEHRINTDLDYIKSCYLLGRSAEGNTTKLNGNDEEPLSIYLNENLF